MFPLLFAFLAFCQHVAVDAQPWDESPWPFQNPNVSRANQDAASVHEHIKRVGRLSPPLGPGKPALGLNFKLYHIVHVNDESQVVGIKARVIYQWIDRRLRWQHTTNLSTRVMRIIGQDNLFWQPEIKIQQSLGIPTMFSRTITNIGAQGEVQQGNYFILHVTCPMSTADFPLDTQHCPLTFYCHSCYGFYGKDPAVRDANVSFPDFRSMDNLTAIKDRYFGDKGGQENNIFEVTNISVRLQANSPVVTVAMKRRSKYYFFYLLSPGVFLMTVSFLQFWIPPETSTIKVGLGVNCLLAMNILFIIVKKSLSPDVNGALPVIGRYFGAEMLMITLITVASTVIVHLHNKGNAIAGRAPSTALIGFCWFLANAFCMRDSAKILQRALSRRRETGQLSGPMERHRKVIDNPYDLDPGRNIERCELLPSTSGARLQANDITSTPVSPRVGTSSCSHTASTPAPATSDSTVPDHAASGGTESPKNAAATLEWKVVASVINNLFLVLALVISVLSAVYILILPIVASRDR